MKLVKGISQLSYQERLKKLQMISIEDRMKRGDLIETYKILTGKVAVNYNQFFELEQDRRTRGHNLKLKIERSIHRSRRMFFSNRVAEAWNRLPEEVVMAKTTNEFKNCLDRHWATVNLN